MFKQCIDIKNHSKCEYYLATMNICLCDLNCHINNEGICEFLLENKFKRKNTYSYKDINCR